MAKRQGKHVWVVLWGKRPLRVKVQVGNWSTFWTWGKVGDGFSSYAQARQFKGKVARWLARSEQPDVHGLSIVCVKVW